MEKTQKLAALFLLFTVFIACNSEQKKLSKHQPEEAGESLNALQNEGIDNPKDFVYKPDEFEAEPTKNSSAKDQRQVTGKTAQKQKVKKVHPKPTLGLYEKTQVPTETFEIDNTKEAVIYGSKGTLVSIPRNCFRTKNGKPVSGKVQIELKEVFSKADLLLSNLPTVSNGRMLETNGSVYINATAEGQPLELAEGRSIYVEVPTDGNPQDMLIFSGSFNEIGNMNWTPVGQLSKVMYTLPFETLDPRIPSMSQSILERIVQPENQNTFLATRNFKKRLNYIEESSAFHHKTDEIVEFYLRNKHLSLSDVDNKILNYFKGLAKCYPHVEVDDPSHKGVFKARKRYRDFYDEQLTRADLIYTHNVALSDENAYQQLLGKGLEEEKAAKVMQHHATRLALIEQKKRLMANRMKSNMSNIAKEFAENNFEIDRLGWINVDKFARMSSTSKLTVKYRKPGHVYTEAFIVFENRRSVISGKGDKGNKFCIFDRIPTGENAHIVLVGFEDDVPFAGVKKIITGKNEIEEVDLSKTNLVALEHKVMQLN